MLNWAITFLLLSLVSMFLTIIGTGSEFVSLLARLASVSFLVVAVAIFFAYVRDRHRHPGAN